MFTPHLQVGGMFPDTVLVSADNVTFHAHSQQLLAASTNAFGGILTQPAHPHILQEQAAVLNIVLHIIYGTSCLRHLPSFETTEAALASLIKYGVPSALLATSQPLSELLLSFAPFRPIDVYALAGQHALERVAVAASAHLLAYDASALSDALTLRMGSVYLGRLLNLQQARLAALRDIVLRPPDAHPPTPACGGAGADAESRGQLARAWAFATAELVWVALPSTSTGALESMFSQAGASITCPDCKAMLQRRIAEVTAEWAAVKVCLFVLCAAVNYGIYTLSAENDMMP